LDSSSGDESNAEEAKAKEPERSGNISNVHIHQNSIFVNKNSPTLKLPNFTQTTRKGTIGNGY
jgi:hypothetical protein